jgi:hypothetical protein
MKDRFCFKAGNLEAFAKMRNWSDQGVEFVKVVRIREVFEGLAVQWEFLDYGSEKSGSGSKTSAVLNDNYIAQ